MRAIHPADLAALRDGEGHVSSPVAVAIRAGLGTYALVSLLSQIASGHSVYWVIGAYLNARAARKTLRLLHAVAFWAAEPEMTE